jgi:integrase
MEHYQRRGRKFRVRIGVDKKLRPYLPPPYTGKAELLHALDTGDEREAKIRGGPIESEFLAMIEAAKARVIFQHRFYFVHPTPVSLTAIVEHRFPTPKTHTITRNGFGARIMQGEPPTHLHEFKPGHFVDVGHPLHPQTFVGIEAEERISFSLLLDLWSKGKPVATIRSYKSKMNELATFLGHDDASRVTKSDMLRYRKSLRDNQWSPENLRGMKERTIAAHLSAIHTVFQVGVEEEKIPLNPAHGVTFVAQADPRDERQDFTPKDRRLILLTARRSSDPAIRWANWLASFQGFRTAEVIEADTRDIEQQNGRWVFHVRLDYRPRGQNIKSSISQRSIPIHSAVLAEGFIEYVRSLPPGPLFPQIEMDKDNRRARKATRDLGKWLRQEVGITNPRKVIHCHRHTFQTIQRELVDGEVIREDVSDYICGHVNSKKKVGRGYGKYPLATLIAAIEHIPNPFAQETIPLAAE